MIASVSLVIARITIRANPSPDVFRLRQGYGGQAVCVALSRGGGDQPFEHIRVRWFGQVMVEPGVARAALVLVLTPAAERDEHDPWTERAADLSRRLEPV